MVYPEYPENSRSCLQHTTDFYTGHCVSAKARWNCVCNLKCHSFGFWVLQSQAVIVWKFDVYIPLPSEGNYDVTTALAIPTAQTSSRKCHFGLCLMDAGVWNVCVSIFFFLEDSDVTIAALFGTTPKRHIPPWVKFFLIGIWNIAIALRRGITCDLLTRDPQLQS